MFSPKTIKKQQRVKEVFAYLGDKYNKKVVINENVIGNKKVRKTHMELFRKLHENGNEVIKNNNYYTLIWKDIVAIFSKSYFIESKRERSKLYIEKIELKGPKAITNLHQIKTSIDYLKAYCKKNKIKELIIDTWMFETFPGFAEHLGFEPTSDSEVLLYKANLLSLGIKKIAFLDFKKKVAHCIMRNKKTGLQETKEISVDALSGFPEYVCKIK